jgi:hypothetical protein
MPEEVDKLTDAIKSVMRAASKEERQAFSDACDKTPDQLTDEDHKRIAPLLKRLREAVAGCTGSSCKLPRILDENGVEYPKSSAQTQTLHKVWDEATPEERAAWHLATCCLGMGNEQEQNLAVSLYMRWMDALRATTDMMQWLANQN